MGGGGGKTRVVRAAARELAHPRPPASHTQPTTAGRSGSATDHCPHKRLLVMIHRKSRSRWVDPAAIFHTNREPSGCGVVCAGQVGLRLAETTHKYPGTIRDIRITFYTHAHIQANKQTHTLTTCTYATTHTPHRAPETERRDARAALILRSLAMSGGPGAGGPRFPAPGDAAVAAATAAAYPSRMGLSWVVSTVSSADAPGASTCCWVWCVGVEVGVLVWCVGVEVGVLVCGSGGWCVGVVCGSGGWCVGVVCGSGGWCGVWEWRLVRCEGVEVGVLVCWCDVREWRLV